MTGNRKFAGLRAWSTALVLALALGAVVLVQPKPAEAHCDSINGPVVNAAKQALALGDVRPVLAYVQPEAEHELTAAYNQAIEVRKLGGNAQLLAETYFFETAVRLHRTDEGASYTGLKYETDFGPALEAAEQALQTGSVEDVKSLLEQALRDGVNAKIEAVVTARSKADSLGTVEAQRERAEAELLFEKYVLSVYDATAGVVGHVEGAAPGAEQAGHAAVAGTATAERTASPYPDWY